jgi:hypothetical protein
MNGRNVIILGIGGCAILALFLFPRWFAWVNRPVSQADRYAESNRVYAAKTAWLKIKPCRLSDLEEKYLDAAKTVSTSLVLHGDDPKDFRAQVEERADERSLVFHLHHISAFALELEAERKGMSIIGNPGGKCCDVIYSQKDGTASKPLLWQ